MSNELIKYLCAPSVMDAVKVAMENLHPKDEFIVGHEKPKCLSDFGWDRPVYCTLLCTSKKTVTTRWRKEANSVYMAFKAYFKIHSDFMDW